MFNISLFTMVFLYQSFFALIYNSRLYQRIVQFFFYTYWKLRKSWVFCSAKFRTILSACYFLAVCFRSTVVIGSTQNKLFLSVKQKTGVRDAFPTREKGPSMGRYDEANANGKRMTDFLQNFFPKPLPMLFWVKEQIISQPLGQMETQLLNNKHE